MNHAHSQKFGIVLGGFLLVAACSDRPLTAPNDAAVDAPDLARAVAASPGTYELVFLKEGGVGGLDSVPDGVSPVGTYLVLASRVFDASGVRVTVGKVTYEYCMLGGDYAPSANCVSGGGTWKRHMTMAVDPYGSRSGFGYCSTPRSIGFRVRYASVRGSSVASGISPARDFTWVEAAP